MSDNATHRFYPHRHKSRFYNHKDEHKASKVIPSVAMAAEACWNALMYKGCDTSFWYTPEKPLDRSKNLAVTWIGHSTFLIQASGINIITDPIFGGMPFFRRQIKAGIELSQVPSIDYVIISHNHRDHMDEKCLTFIKKNHPNVHFLVPMGDKAWFDRRGFKGVREYNWWEQDVFIHELGSITFSFLPAFHWSQRGLFDYNKSLWGSWMIQVEGHALYFAGDTAYSSHFSAIAKEFPSIDYAFMPIGPCEPRSWMQLTHVSAEEAGQGFLELAAQKFIPMHWATFKFGTDYHEGPYERILAWWHKQKLSEPKEFIAFKIGQRYVIAEPYRGADILRPVIKEIRF